MFKKIKENEKVIKLKELWQNPRTHDIMVLSFWLVFIFIVILFARSIGSSPKTSNDDNRQASDFASMKSYDFTYKTNDKVINGEAYEDALVFYVDNKRYYYKDNTYLIEEKASLINYDLDVLKINTTMLNSLISGITASDTGNFKQYIVPLDRFINLYEIDTDADLSRAATYNVVISVYLVDNEISKVVLDLSNYYSLKTGSSVNYPVTIYYYNVNKVSDFKKGFEKLKEAY